MAQDYRMPKNIADAIEKVRVARLEDEQAAAAEKAADKALVDAKAQHKLTSTAALDAQRALSALIEQATKP